MNCKLKFLLLKLSAFTMLIGGALWLLVSIDCWMDDKNRCTVVSFSASLVYMVACLLCHAVWFLDRKRGEDTMFGRDEIVARHRNALYRFVVRHVDFVFISNVLFFVGVVCDLAETFHYGVLRKYEPADKVFLIGNAFWATEALIEMIGALIDIHHRRVLKSSIQFTFRCSCRVANEHETVMNLFSWRVLCAAIFMVANYTYMIAFVLVVYAGRGDLSNSFSLIGGILFVLYAPICYLDIRQEEIYISTREQDSCEIDQRLPQRNNR